MIIAELRGRCRQLPGVLGGEGEILGTKDILSWSRTCGHSLKPCLHKFSQIYMYSVSIIIITIIIIIFIIIIIIIIIIIYYYYYYYI